MRYTNKKYVTFTINLYFFHKIRFNVIFRKVCYIHYTLAENNFESNDAHKTIFSKL